MKQSVTINMQEKIEKENGEKPKIEAFDIILELTQMISDLEQSRNIPAEKIALLIERFARNLIIIEKIEETYRSVSLAQSFVDKHIEPVIKGYNIILQSLHVLQENISNNRLALHQLGNVYERYMSLNVNLNTISYMQRGYILTKKQSEQVEREIRAFDNHIRNESPSLTIPWRLIYDNQNRAKLIKLLNNNTHIINAFIKISNHIKLDETAEVAQFIREVLDANPNISYTIKLESYVATGYSIDGESKYLEEDDIESIIYIDVISKIFATSINACHLDLNACKDSMIRLKMINAIKQNEQYIDWATLFISQETEETATHSHWKCSIEVLQQLLTKRSIDLDKKDMLAILANFEYGIEYLQQLLIQRVRIKKEEISARYSQFKFAMKHIQQLITKQIVHLRERDISIILYSFGYTIEYVRQLLLSTDVRLSQETQLTDPNLKEIIEYLQQLQQLFAKQRASKETEGILIVNSKLRDIIEQLPQLQQLLTKLVSSQEQEEIIAISSNLIKVIEHLQQLSAREEASQQENEMLTILANFKYSIGYLQQLLTEQGASQAVVAKNIMLYRLLFTEENRGRMTYSSELSQECDHRLVQVKIFYKLAPNFLDMIELMIQRRKAFIHKLSIILQAIDDDGVPSSIFTNKIEELFPNLQALHQFLLQVAKFSYYPHHLIGQDIQEALFNELNNIPFSKTDKADNMIGESKLRAIYNHLNYIYLNYPKEVENDNAIEEEEKPALPLRLSIDILRSLSDDYIRCNKSFEMSRPTPPNASSLSMLNSTPPNASSLSILNSTPPRMSLSYLLNATQPDTIAQPPTIGLAQSTVFSSRSPLLVHPTTNALIHPNIINDASVVAQESFEHQLKRRKLAHKANQEELSKARGNK